MPQEIDFAEIVKIWIFAWEKAHGEKFSKKEFSASIKMSPTSFSRIINRSVEKPSSDSMIKIAQGFGVSLGEFLQGPEKNYPQQHPEHHIDYGADPLSFTSIPFVGKRVTPDLNGEDVYVPHYKIKVSAGGGMCVEESEQKQLLPFKSDWVYKVLKANPNNLVLVDVYGNSMEPTLYHGDVVLVDTSRTALNKDGLYVFRTDDDLFVKRIERQLGDRILVKSDNPMFSAFYFDPAHSMVFGKVVWRAGIIQ